MEDMSENSNADENLAESTGAAETRHLETLFQLEGLGKELWIGVDADDYVRELREEWS